MYFFLDRPNTRNCCGVLESKNSWSAESVEHLDRILPTVLFVYEVQTGKYPPKEPSRIFQMKNGILHKWYINVNLFLLRVLS